jgi:hypothetical protein
MCYEDEQEIVKLFGNHTTHPIRSIWAFRITDDKFCFKYYPEHNDPYIALDLVEHCVDLTLELANRFKEEDITISKPRTGVREQGTHWLDGSDTGPLLNGANA